MRLFIIGRLLNKKGKVVAYKLYDPDKKQTAIIQKKDVQAVALQEKAEVVGLVRTNGKVITVHSSFNVRKTDSLNGKGEPIEPSGRYVLLGYSDFLEETKYRLVDSSGNEKIVLEEEFKQMVAEDKINGAMLSEHKKKIVMYKPCNQREYHL